MVGIASRDGSRPSTDPELGALCRAYERLRGAAGGERARAGELGSVCVFGADAGAELTRSADGSWVLRCGNAHGPANGAANVEELEGQFVWARYDAQRGALQIANDPFGMRSLFVAERDGLVFFSTSALALAAHLRARPDVLGVNVFLRAGFHFGTRTNWEEIERLDPATRFTFTPQGARRETYWAPRIDERVRTLGLDEAVEHCLSVASDAYRKFYAEPERGAWADLTGGWDSRLMTTLLARAGVNFCTSTTGDERSPDVRVGARVANAAGWDWKRLDIPADWARIMPGLVALALAWGDCHLDALQLAEVLWGHLEKARQHQQLFIGGGGEHFRDRAWQQEFFDGGRTRRVNFGNYVDMRLLKPLDTSVFVRDPTAEVRDDLGARMRARAEPYSQYLNSTQLDVMHAYKNTGHFGAYLSAGAGAIPAELPFYLRPVFTAAFSTSHRHRGSHRLMRCMIQALDPRIAAVPTEAGGPATPIGIRNSYRFLPYYATLGQRAVNKLSQRTLAR
ncbi:MAG TPA: hypothetical protein VH115_06775, partial [Solirubrobacteraceae bacterium]|nr:hypothetical protein [Solirubrobacteraceae bacterium]